MPNRNEQITQTIENERIPLLPFELVVAKGAMARHVGKQAELGRTMGEMMQQSSETWHDNAPAEAVMHDSKILANVAERTIKVLQNAEMFGYGDEKDSAVSLGSIVGVKYGDDEEIVHMFVTGALRELPDAHMLDEYVDEGEELECVTLSSPIGQAIFDKAAGESTDFGINGRKIKLTIAYVKQFSE